MSSYLDLLNLIDKQHPANDPPGRWHGFEFLKRGWCRLFHRNHTYPTIWEGATCVSGPPWHCRICHPWLEVALRCSTFSPHGSFFLERRKKRAWLWFVVLRPGIEEALRELEKSGWEIVSVFSRPNERLLVVGRRPHGAPTPATAVFRACRRPLET